MGVKITAKLLVDKKRKVLKFHALRVYLQPILRKHLAKSEQGKLSVLCGFAKEIKAEFIGILPKRKVKAVAMIGILRAEKLIKKAD